MKPDIGDRIEVSDYNNVIRTGVVMELLSSMYYVEFDTDVTPYSSFYSYTDKSVKKI